MPRIFICLLLLASATVQAQDRQDVSLTVYNGDLGLVTEVRKIKMPAGKSEIRLSDVPSQKIGRASCRERV